MKHLSKCVLALFAACTVGMTSPTTARGDVEITDVSFCASNDCSTNCGPNVSVPYGGTFHVKVTATVSNGGTWKSSTLKINGICVCLDKNDNEDGNDTQDSCVDSDDFCSDGTYSVCYAISLGDFGNPCSIDRVKLIARAGNDCAEDELDNYTCVPGAITVLDSQTPQPLCLNHVCICLDKNGSYELNAYDLFGSAADNCAGAVSVAVARKDNNGTTVSCADLAPEDGGTNPGGQAPNCFVGSPPRCGAGEVCVVVTVTDAAGNHTTCNGCVKVLDCSPPFFQTCGLVNDTDDKPNDGVIGTNEGLCYATPTFTAPLAYDNCTPEELIGLTVDLYPPCGQDLYTYDKDGVETKGSDGYDDPPLYDLTAAELDGRQYATGTTVLVWKVTDVAGNCNRCISYVRVEDREKPGLICHDPDPITLYGADCRTWVDIPKICETDVSDNCTDDYSLLCTVRNNRTCHFDVLGNLTGNNDPKDASDIYPVQCNPGTCVTWTVKDSATKQRDIVVAIDISGSIDEAELLIEIEQVIGALKCLPCDGSQFVSIVVYASTAKVLLPLTPVTGFALSNYGPIGHCGKWLCHNLADLQAELGGTLTNVVDAIKKAIGILDGGSCRDVLVILGDGEDTVNPSGSVGDACGHAAEKGIEICAIAIGAPSYVWCECADASDGCKKSVQTRSLGGQVKNAVEGCLKHILRDDPNCQQCKITVCVGRPNPPLLKCGADVCVSNDENRCDAFIDFCNGPDGHTPLNPFVFDVCTPRDCLQITHRIISSPLGGADSGTNCCGCFDTGECGDSECLGCTLEEPSDCEIHGDGEPGQPAQNVPTTLSCCGTKYCKKCDQDATGCYPLGVTVIEWKVYNPDTGLSNYCQQKVTVIDEQCPYLDFECPAPAPGVFPTSKVVYANGNCNEICPEDVIAQLLDDGGILGKAPICRDNCDGSSLFIVDVDALDLDYINLCGVPTSQPAPVGLGDGHEEYDRNCGLPGNDPVPARTECFGLGNHGIVIMCSDNAVDCDGNPDPNYSNYCCIQISVVSGPCGGACCVGETCSITTPAQCGAAGGVYQGDNTNCTPNPCALPRGGCCVGTSCQLLTLAQCTAAGGGFLGNNSVCGPTSCTVPTGACCLGQGVCSVLTSGQCISAQGAYQGNGTDCSPNPCPQPVGACCFGSNGSCAVVTMLVCDEKDGLYFGNGTDCDPNPCTVTTQPTDNENENGNGNGNDNAVAGVTNPGSNNNGNDNTNTEVDNGSGFFLCGPSSAGVLSMVLLGIAVMRVGIRRRRVR